MTAYLTSAAISALEFIAAADEGVNRPAALCRHLLENQDLTQEELQRVLRGIIQINHGTEVTVPMSDAVEKCHDGNNRHRERQYDFDE